MLEEIIIVLKRGEVDKMVYIMAIKIVPRNEIAPIVQEVLTKYGGIIKVRLGLHDKAGKEDVTSGIILLQLLEDLTEIKKLEKELNDLEAVSAKTIEI